jgi:hypothetical protein
MSNVAVCGDGKDAGGMANSNAPYGFRLYSRLSAGSGAMPVTPGAAAGGTYSSSGPLPVASATTLKVGDPIKSSLGLGYLATGTNAVFGINNSPVPGYGETATQKHYPELLPADDSTVWRAQSIGTQNVTQGYIGVAAKKYRLGNATSGYMGVDLGHTTGGVLEIIGLAPGSAFGTYAELLVIFTRGAFYGQA